MGQGQFTGLIYIVCTVLVLTLAFAVGCTPTGRETPNSYYTGNGWYGSHYVGTRPDRPTKRNLRHF